MSSINKSEVVKPFDKLWHLICLQLRLASRRKGISKEARAMAMAARRFLQTLVANQSSCSYNYGIISRSISSSPRLESMEWFDKIKSAVTGKGTDGKGTDPKPESFSLIDFADQMDKARKLGQLKNFVVGRCSETTISHAFEKHSVVLRYLGAIDASAENLTKSHKNDAAKHCNCTIADVEYILAKYSWAKEAQKKIEKLKEEGKPLPKSFSEVQKLVGSTPMEVGQSNLAKSGQISRNAMCPCKSGKRYKRCCGANTTNGEK